MSRKLLLPAFVGFTLVLFACDRVASHEDEAPIDIAAAADSVRRAEAGVLAAFKARDSAKLASHYADDAVFAAPGAPPAVGREAIAKAHAEAFRDPGFNLDFTNEKTEVAASGDLAYTRGSYRLAFTDPATKRVVASAGGYLTVFRKQGGDWKAVADYVTPGAEAASPTLPLPPPKG